MQNLENECSLFNFDLERNINFNTAKFVDWSNELVERYFPIKRKDITYKRFSSPWINTAITKLILKKHKWFNLLKAKIISYKCYKCYANDLRKLLKLAESRYYKNKLKSLRTDPKNNWKILNSLLGRKKKEQVQSFIINNENIIDAGIIASEFNKYFESIPNEIRAEIQETNLDGLRHIARNDHSMVLFQCTNAEVVNIVKSMKGSKVENDVN
jgi:hypothetical protein